MQLAAPSMIESTSTGGGDMLNRRYEFWIDNGEERSEENLMNPDLRLIDEIGTMTIDQMASWAADELATTSDDRMALIVCRKGERAADEHDTWHEVELVRGGFHVYRNTEIDRKDLLPCG